MCYIVSKKSADLNTDLSQYPYRDNSFSNQVIPFIIITYLLWYTNM